MLTKLASKKGFSCMFLKKIPVLKTSRTKENGSKGKMEFIRFMTNIITEATTIFLFLILDPIRAVQVKHLITLMQATTTREPWEEREKRTPREEQ